MPEPRPFDIADLERLCPHGQTALDRARYLGINARELYRLRKAGLTVDQADRLAINLGVHPGLVWVETWWQQAA